ncbi:hypothetical protein FB45DRAFT_1006185 [Roridomyces roridus]|uniref:Uncharacterized protein n=1 Tax=Roridomyces roridus TaxID=1738132 RepID=A0AAD7FIB9_9AGAR|nr:hypothetical protein FB45DRAFT_1006185 [Roridomyces roridus]
MHHALQIDEIARCICAQISRPGPSDWCDGLPVQQYPRGSCDLSNLARTCTTLSEPSLDALWSFQGTILHLLRTMPSDLWDITIQVPRGVDVSDANSREENMSLGISPRRIVRASDWGRFAFYARRVRSFKDRHVHSETSVVYDILATKFPNGAVFPRLEIIDWASKDSQLFHHVRLFLSPGITRLHIHSNYAANFTILETLSRELPGLKNVDVSGAAPNSFTSPFVGALHDLETLIVWNLDLKAFEHLSRLPRLRYLWLMSNTPPRLSPRPKDLPCFPALRIFECESIEAAPNLLEQMGRSLVEFRLSSRSWATSPTKQVFQELYAALASSCTHSLLQEIAVDEAWHAQQINHTQIDLHAVSGDDLRQLFCFRNLVHVSLAHRIAVDLDDVVALDMARAWPRIEVLEFPCDMAQCIAPRMTLEGLYAFAEHCPLLRELSLLFDATAAKSKLASEGKQLRVSQDTLTSLDVAYSSIGTKKREWRRVAHFLCLIFPKMSKLEATQPDSSADARAWAMHRAWMQVSNKTF